MLQRRGSILLCAFSLLTLLLAGCWNRRELEEYAFVLALGIDQGERHAYAVTAAIAIPSMIAGAEAKPAGGGEEQPLLITTVEAPTIAVALQMMDSWIDRRVSLLHTKSVVLGEEQARENALDPIRQLVRFREARRTMFFAVSKGRADEFLSQMDVRIERDPQRFIQQLASAYQFTGFVPEMAQLHDALAAIETRRRTPVVYFVALRDEEEEDWNRKSPHDPTRPAGGYVSGEIPRKGGPNIDMMGAAVLDNKRMVGLLTGEENRLTLLVKNRFRRGYFTMPDPSDPTKRVALDIRAGRPPQITVERDSTRTVVRVYLRLEGELLSVDVNTDYTSDEMRPVLERAAEQQIEQQLRDLVEKAQTELRADIFGLGEHAASRFATVDEWAQFDWPSRFPEARIHMTVRMKIRRYGTQLAPVNR